MMPYGQHHIDEEDLQAVVDVLRSRALTQSPAIEAVERALATWIEHNHEKVGII